MLWFRWNEFKRSKIKESKTIQSRPSWI